MKYFLFIFFFLLVCCGYAQVGSPFEQISVATGLPTNYIFCVNEDADGFLWAGSDKGLLRYNGKSWESYTKENGLPGNYVLSIVSNNRSGFVLNISESGLVWWDVRARKRYTLKLPLRFRGSVLTSAFADKNGEIYFPVYTNDSLFYLKTGKEKPQNLEFVCSYKLLQLKTGEHAEYPKSPPLQPKIYAFFSDNVISSNKSAEYVYPTSIKKNSLLAKPNGTYVMTKSFIIGQDYIYKRDEADLSPWINEKFFENKSREKSYLEVGNKLFIGKMSEGLCIINEKGKLEKYTRDNGLSSNNIISFYLGNDSAVYICTLGGGINILKKNPRLKFNIENGPVEDIQEDNGIIYFNTQKKIYALEEDKIKFSIDLPKDILSFKVAKNKLYTANFEEMKTQILQGSVVLLKEKVLYTAGISDMFQVRDGIVASTYGGGIISIKNNNIELTRNNYPFQNIERLIKTSNGYFALSYESGFYCLDTTLLLKKFYQKKNGLLSNEIYYVHQYNDSLFVAGRDGITIISKNNKYKSYSYGDGFKGSVAKYIFTDSLGTHWVVSNAYLHKLVNNKLFAIGSARLTFNERDEISTSFFSTRLQKLFAGTSAGICELDVRNLQIDKKVIYPAVYQVTSGSDTLLTSVVYKLPFFYNNIAFHFKNINSLQHSNKILYKLNGYNSDWVALPDSLVVSFEKLRPGDYTLFAKSINIDGIESKIITIAKVKINQVIWLQWWMLLLYIFAFILVAIILLQWRQKFRYKKKLQELKLARELENERQRISRDLHDNMGAYTTALLTNIDNMETARGKFPEVEKMKKNAGEILSSLRETIWVLNNKEISIHDFSDVFTTYCFKILNNFEDIEFDVEEVIENNQTLAAADAIHLNKILQELFQNSLKHSNCTKIYYQVLCNHNLKIIFGDNGKGYDESKITKGNGLENILWRLKEIHASAEIFSDGATGTSITITK